MPHSAPPHGFLRRNAVKLALSVVITLSLLFALKSSGLELWPSPSAFRDVRWWTVPTYVLFLAALSYFRAARWRYLLKPFAELPQRRIVLASLVGFAAILLVPFRLGEVVRPIMIREKGKVSMTAATGTVVGERVVDGLFLSLVLAVVLVLAPMRNPAAMEVPGIPGAVNVAHVRHAGFVMLGLFTCAFTVIAVFYFARSWAQRLTYAVFGVVSEKLAHKLAEMASKLADGLHFLEQPRLAGPFLGETAAYWGINALGMWFLAWGCGVTHADGTSLTFLESCALMGTLGVTILIPGPPGALGLFQAGLFMGMAMYVPKETVLGAGAAYAALMYAVQFGWHVLSGAASLALLGGGFAALRAAADAEEIPASVAPVEAAAER